MNCIKIILGITISALVLSCDEAVIRYSRIDFIIPEQINIRQDELLKAWSDENSRDPASGIVIVVTVYSFSSGSETFSFSGNGDMQTVKAEGRVKCLVKVMDGDKLVRAEFIEGTGKNRDELFSSVIREIKRKLFNHR